MIWIIIGVLSLIALASFMACDLGGWDQLFDCFFPLIVAVLVVGSVGAIIYGLVEVTNG